MKINHINQSFTNANATQLKPMGINNFAKFSKNPNQVAFAPMPTIQETPTKKKINKKAIIGGLIAFGALAGAVVLALRGKKIAKAESKVS